MLKGAIMAVCISIATDDGVYVKDGHFGDAVFYLHFILENNEWRLVRRIMNPFRKMHGHGRKRSLILELNRSCGFVVATAFGPGGHEFIRSKGIEPIIVRPGTRIAEALEMVKKRLSSYK